MNSLDVTEFITENENFAILFDGVPIADIIGLKGGHLSTMFLCTLQRSFKTPGLEIRTLKRPYKTPGFHPTALIFLCHSIRKALDDFKDFK